MRIAFARTLAELAEQDRRILLLTGDLGYTAIEPFSERFPDRFINVGVAEQNMVGLAAGLAEAGFRPFLYSIATFAALRPYEFFRDGPILQRLPVRLVGVGGGFEYGSAGPTHHALEDIGVMRLQPGLTVIVPADHQQTASAIRQTWDLPGPIYYRLGKDDRTVVPGLDGRFALGRVETLRDGRDAHIVTTGAIAVDAVAAAERLAGEGIACGVSVVATIRPAPVDDLRAILARHSLVVTYEAHYAVGGLGSLVAEVAAELSGAGRVVRRGVERSTAGRSGSQAYLAAELGLTAAQLAQTVRRELRPSRP